MNAFLDISGTLDIFSELKKQSQRWIGYHLDQEIQSWIEEMEGEEWWTGSGSQPTSDWCAGRPKFLDDKFYIVGLRIENGKELYFELEFDIKISFSGTADAYGYTDEDGTPSLEVDADMRYTSCSLCAVLSLKDLDKNIDFRFFNFTYKDKIIIDGSDTDDSDYFYD